MLVARQEAPGDLSAKGGASDLVQETFMVAQKRFASFSGGDEGQLRAWLRAILLRRLAKFRARYVATEMRQVSREVGLGKAIPAAAIPGDLTTPSGLAHRREVHEALERAMAQLPDHYRKAVLLRHQQSLRFDQIGVALGTTAEAARKYWARGVEQLRRELGPIAP
jgi:RNA polymerase sigma-70 factor (ECF subfamily)